MARHPVRDAVGNPCPVEIMAYSVKYPSPLLWPIYRHEPVFD